MILYSGSAPGKILYQSLYTYLGKRSLLLLNPNTRFQHSRFSNLVATARITRMFDRPQLLKWLLRPPDIGILGLAQAMIG